MDRMNILTATDDNYAPWCGVMLTSLFKHNADVDIHVYILGDNISDKNIKKFQQLSPNVHIIDLCDIDFDSWVPSLSLGEYLSRTTWARLAVGDVLPPNIDKILHIDADTIILGSLRELYDTDLEDMAAAAVDEYRDASYLDIKGKYFNAGVILFNVDYFRKHDVKNRCIELAKAYSDIIRFHDQDVLNKAFEGKVIFKHRKFNLTCYGKVISDDLRKDADFKEDMEAVFNNDVRIYHFVGKVKPWIYYNFEPMAFNICWRNVYRRSLWKTTPLISTRAGLKDKFMVIIVNFLCRIRLKQYQNNKSWVRLYPNSTWYRIKSFFSLDSYR